MSLQKWFFRFILGVTVIVSGGMLETYNLVPNNVLYFSGFVVASIFNIFVKEW